MSVFDNVIKELETRSKYKSFVKSAFNIVLPKKLDELITSRLDELIKLGKLMRHIFTFYDKLGARRKEKLVKSSNEGYTTPYGTVESDVLSITASREPLGISLTFMVSKNKDDMLMYLSIFGVTFNISVGSDGKLEINCTYYEEDVALIVEILTKLDRILKNINEMIDDVKEFMEETAREVLTSMEYLKEDRIKTIMSKYGSIVAVEKI